MPSSPKAKAKAKASEPIPTGDRVAELEKALAEERSSGAKRFRLVVEAAPSGIVMVDEEGKIVLANRKAQEMFGYEPEEMLGLGVEALLPARAREEHSASRQDYIERPEARPMGGGRDLFAQRKSGAEFPVEIGLTPVTESGRRFVLGVIVDISERMKAQSAMRLQAQLLESLHEAVFLVGSDGRIRTWNQGAAGIFGWSAEEALGRDASFLCVDREQAAFRRRVFDRVSATGEALTTLRSLHKNGAEVILSVRASRNEGKDGPDGVIVCANDITRQKHLEDQILQIAENEQRRIGQDIHDDLCQQLAGISCLAKVLQQQYESLSESGSKSLAQIGEMVSQANVKAREISRGLAPAVIEREGLESALAEIARRTRKVFGVDCEFHCPDPVFFEDKRVAVQLYRIAQEAVGNAVKHSDAQKVVIRLEARDRRLHLSVTDDGQGIAPAQQNTGMGLLTMEHRARVLEGELDVHSTPTEGTRIVCTVPLPAE